MDNTTKTFFLKGLAGVIMTIVAGLSIAGFGIAPTPAAHAATRDLYCHVTVETPLKVDMTGPGAETFITAQIRKTGDCSKYKGDDFIVKNQENAIMTRFHFDGTDTFAAFAVQYPGLYQAYRVGEPQYGLGGVPIVSYTPPTSISVKFASTITLLKHSHKGKHLMLKARADYYEGALHAVIPWVNGTFRFQYKTVAGKWKTAESVLPNIKGVATYKGTIKGKREWRVITVGTVNVRGHHTETVRL